MCSRLDDYKTALTKLRVDTNKKNWGPLTGFRSPYKPFLLLSIFDGIGSGEINRTFIEPTFELNETFQRYIRILPPLSRQASMALPMYYMKSSAFWTLKPKHQSAEQFGSIGSIPQFKKYFYGAEITPDLFALLKMQTSREKLREVLIATYFAPEIRQQIRDQAFINCESVKYSDILLANRTDTQEETGEANLPYLYADGEPTTSPKIRDQGFRKAVVKLYDHRCSLCGIKMRTPEGHTVVDAAHIIPWGESNNDHPTNGLALCKLCHWSFDEGLMTVNKSYQVMISNAVQLDNNLPGHIMTLSDRPIFRPSNSNFWPDQKSFDWHRHHRFR